LSNLPNNLQEVKGNAQEKWAELKDKAEQFKQTHTGEQPSGSASGSANFNGDSASADVKVN
jgi:hypothetical protein